MRSNFLTLCEYELRKAFGVSGSTKKRKRDFIGSFLSIAITIGIAVAFVFFLSIIASNYAEVKINKVSDPIARAAEFMNFTYTAIIVALTLVSLERMRKVFAKTAESEVFLRLPVSPSVLFMSKMLVVVLETYFVALMLAIPNCIVISGMIETTSTFWITSAIIYLALPIIPIAVSSVLIIPYMKLVDFLMHKYLLLFTVVTAGLALAFIVYSRLLLVVQSLLETGSVKFLFNEQFIVFMQTLRRITYPANILTDINLGLNVGISLGIVIVAAVVLVVIACIIVRTMFYSTLYKDDKRKLGNSDGRSFSRESVGSALLRKEFINVSRTPEYMFSYFAIAAAMPIMVYSCYTMFYSLIEHALGIKVDFALALLVVLVFGVLTNTFCATNVSRDGLSALSTKIYPVEPTKIMGAKVIFCMIVSSVSVLLSALLLMILTPLGVVNAIAVAIFGIIFSAAQIFIATRLDLNHAHVASGPLETERAAEKTTTKVVTIGLISAMLVGVSALVMSLVLGAGEDILSFGISYLVPFAITAVYFVLAVLYYSINIERSFYNLAS